MALLKIMTVVGARPQFVKAAVVSRAIVEHNRGASARHIVEQMVHTGQHYDYMMSQAFFDEMAIPRPVVNLAVGSGSHGAMLGVASAVRKKRSESWIFRPRLRCVRDCPKRWNGRKNTYPLASNVWISTAPICHGSFSPAYA